MLELILFILFFVVIGVAVICISLDLSGYFKTLPISIYQKWIKLRLIIGIILVSYIVVYPSIYRSFVLKRAEISKKLGEERASQIKISPIDENMQSLIDEKIQRETSQIKLDANANQAYQNAKIYLNSNYRDTNAPITSFIFDSKYEYTYNDEKYIITFKVTLNLANSTFLNKRFYFYMNEDDAKPMGNVWKVLYYEEENL